MREPGEPGTAMAHDLPDRRAAAELEALRATCWRQQQEIRGLRETVAVLRDGANRLAGETVMLRHALAAAHRARRHRRSRSRCLRAH